MKKHPIALIVVWISCVLCNAANVPRLSELEPGPRGDKGLFIEPWEIWMSQPISSPVLIEATGKAMNGTDISISITGLTNTVSGSDCSQLTPTNRFYPSLRAYVPYNVSVSGPNWSELNLTFKGYIPSGILPVRGPLAVPRPYHVYINGTELLSIDTLQISFNCGNNTTNFTFEIRPHRGVRPAVFGQFEEYWSNDEAEDEGAPGDGEWLQLGPGRSTDVNKTAFRWSVALGRLINGLTAGRLRLSEEAISSNVFSGQTLTYTARSTNINEVDLRFDTNGILRQIKTLQALAEISSTYSPTEECLIKFYIPSHVGSSTNGAGFYPILTNSPFVIWKLRNPNSPGTYSSIQVIEERPAGRSYTTDLQFEGTNIWKLANGVGSDQRIERRAVLINGQSRRETVTVGSSSVINYKAIEDYHKFDWGWELTNVVTNPDGQALTNRFSYYTNAAEPNSYSRLRERWFPGNRWELSSYPYEGDSDWAAEGWPIGDFPFPQLSGDVIRIRPLEDAPSTYSEANLTNVVFSEFARDLSGTSTRGRERNTDVRIAPTEANPNGQRVIIYEDDLREPAYDSKTNIVLFEYRFKTFAFGWKAEPQVTYKLNALGNWRNNLLRYHKSADSVCNLYEHSPGTLDANFNWSGNTNGLDFLTVQTSGLDYTSILPTASYTNNAPEYAGFGVNYIYCVQGKSRQEQKFLTAGLPVYIRSFGMSSISNSLPVWNLLETRKLLYDSLGHLTNVTWIDPADASISRILYESSWKDASGKDAELKQFEVFETGERVNYTYDSRKRLKTATLAAAAVNGVYSAIPEITTNYVFNAASWHTETTISGAGLSLTEKQTYDLSGRFLSRLNYDQTTIAYTYSGDTKIVTETLPGGITKSTTRYLDGRVKAIEGTAIVPEHYDYDLAPPDHVGAYPHPNLTTVYRGTNASPRWRQQASYPTGAPYYLSVPEFNTADGLDTYFSYDVVGTSVNAAYLSDVYSPGSILDEQFEYHVTEIAYDRFAAIETYSWENASYSDSRLDSVLTLDEFDGTNWWRVHSREWYGDSATFTNVTRERLTGFTSTNTLTDATYIDHEGNVSIITVTLEKANKKVTAVTNTPYSTINITAVTRNGLLQSINTDSISTPTYFYYDGLRREIAQKSPLGIVTGTAFHPVTGWVTATTNAAQQVTVIEPIATNLANAGLPKWIQLPNGKKTYFEYNSRGQQTKMWGDVPYPEERVYDSTYGDLIQLKTYRDGSNWSNSGWPGDGETADVTTWTYDAATGLLLSKVDASGQGYTNNYDRAHALTTRTWARGVTVTNRWNGFGQILSKKYSDGTPDFEVTGPQNWYAYNALGQPRIIVDDAAGNIHFTYAPDGDLIATTWGSGPLAGLTVTNGTHTLYGKEVTALLDIYSDPAIRTIYGYDTASGRLNVVSNGLNSASYTYQPNSDLISTVTFKDNGATRLTTSKGWEHGYRLRSIRNMAGATVVSSHSYVYDALDRRTAAALHDNSTWQYDYNDRSELIAGKRFWDDWTPVSGQQFEYGYDPIGNRTVARGGGDEYGQSLRETTYGANELNQYSVVTNSPYAQVTGFASATASVSVNSSPAYERDEYFHREIAVSNGLGPIAQSISAVASLTGTNATETGTLIVAEAEQDFTYDLDGNLTHDGIWSYQWDAENRLKSITMTNVANVADTNRFRLEFSYDFQGRRFSKTVYSWSSSTNGFVPFSTNLFIYDGWNLLAELDGGAPLDPLPLVRSYAWGLDLADSFEEAGGIGGLLLFTDHTPLTDTYHYPAYDGNGNVTGLIQSSGSPTALYDYSPFGELIRSTGPASRLNPFQFSTKYLDQETGLTYYGHRYYSTSLGRWISRDPIEEEDGPNVYAFVKNRPPTLFDALGMNTSAEQGTAGAGASSLSSAGSQAITILNQIQETIDTFNFVQELVSMAMELEDDNDGEMLIGGLQMAGTILSDGLRKLADRETTLYRLVDSTTQEHLKFGITSNPDKRYTDAQLKRLNAKMVPLAKGKRVDMLRIERFLHAVHPLGKLEGQKWYRVWQAVQLVVLKGRK